MPDISYIAEDFTNAKSEILKKHLDVVIRCFLISQGKYYKLIEPVVIHPSI